jgi:hypothetical protein
MPALNRGFASLTAQSRRHVGNRWSLSDIRSTRCEKNGFQNGSKMRIRKADEIRWYLYQSRTKQEMLFQQMVSSTGPFSGSVTFDIPGMKATLGTSLNPELTDEEKWDVIEQQLRAKELVGTPSEPGEFFAGEMRMRWGMFDDHGARPEMAPPLVFFGGIDKAEKIIVGLGGSSAHVVGYSGASSTHSRSHTRALVDWLLADIQQATLPQAWDPEAESQEILSAVAIALHYLRPPTQRLRFLAKTLLRGDSYGHEHMTGLDSAKTILGSPLYVLLTEIPDDSNRWGLDEEW